MKSIEIIGRLASEPELVVTTNGNSILKFRLLSNERDYNPQTKKYDKERTEATNCKMFGERGQRLKEMIQKGTMLYVRGDVHREEWDSQQYGKQHDDVCYISECFLLKDGTPRRRQEAQPVEEPREEAQASGGPEGWHDEIPF